MQTWEDLFEIVEVNPYKYGGSCVYGGDPHMGVKNVPVYKLKFKHTGELDAYLPMPMYTIKIHARNRFEEYKDEVDKILLEE